jgi:hypothetical protein
MRNVAPVCPSTLPISTVRVLWWLQILGDGQMRVISDL